jgi:hypothetical protein
VETTSLARSPAVDTTRGVALVTRGDTPFTVARPRWLTAYIAVLVGVDGLAMVAATVTSNAAWLGINPGDLHVRSFAIPYSALILVTVPTWLAILALVGAYDLGPFATSDHQARVRIARAGAQLLAVVAVSYYVVRLAMLGRGVLVALIPLAVVFTIAGRAAAAAGLHLARLRGHARRTALVVGTEAAVAAVVDGIDRSGAPALRVVGVSVVTPIGEPGNGAAGAAPNGQLSSDSDGNGNGDTDAGRGNRNGHGLADGARTGDAGNGTGGDATGGVGNGNHAGATRTAGNGTGTRDAQADPRAVLAAVARTRAQSVIIAGDLAHDRLREIAWALEGTGVDLLVSTAPGARPGLRSENPVADLPLLHVDQ